MEAVKIVVFTPKSHSVAVRKAMGDAGAGRIGLYSHCSFSLDGKGRYKSMKDAKPFIGKAGNFEEVEEEKIEYFCEKKIAKKVIKAMKKAHPYQEVAFDIYPLISEENL